DAGIALANAKQEAFLILTENHLLPEYSSMPQRQLERATSLFLYFPNNPTAATGTKALFADTVSIVKEDDNFVVDDFASGAFWFDVEKAVSCWQSDSAKDIGIETYSLSITYNMAGWRVALAVGYPSVIEHFTTFQSPR